MNQGINSQMMWRLDRQMEARSTAHPNAKLVAPIRIQVKSEEDGRTHGSDTDAVIVNLGWRKTSPAYKDDANTLIFT